MRQSTRYPEWRRFFVERLPLALSRDAEAKLAFRGKLSAYFRGELPHCKEVVTSTLLCLLDTSTASNICNEQVDGSNIVLRVSRPWPSRTEKALRMSLDNGLFDDFEVVIPPRPAVPSYTVYLATAIAGGFFSKFGHAGMSQRSRARSRWPIIFQSSALVRLRVRSLPFNVGDKSPYPPPLFSHGLVGRPSRTTRTPTPSLSSHLGQNTLNHSQVGAPQTLSSEDAHVR